MLITYNHIYYIRNVLFKKSIFTANKLSFVQKKTKVWVHKEAPMMEKYFNLSKIIMSPHLSPHRITYLAPLHYTHTHTHAQDRQ